MEGQGVDGPSEPPGVVNIHIPAAIMMTNLHKPDVLVLTIMLMNL